ncbi:hypothetical protein EJ06DRAFT_46166 [Trichodelitschia bisporula]|uniref:Zn(2)-C6 fungal-type domain-containing protein n=1 Tax=Trichodelitschia bisporula TaxID=703511 RepID=A0A6G1HVX2_9PEZI|nr:hypothetical protein EJ06DRAFT_46166 [Trichodelitschia bisporula]
MTSPRMSSVNSTDSSEGSARKRVCKACDRCRLKKSKCDGANPCSRCKTDNAICNFGERRKTHDKVHPKGYVEMLEQQQYQLVEAVREMYRRLQSGEGWPGAPLQAAHGGSPLTHDILERLDLLHSNGDNPLQHEGFEENVDRLRERAARSIGTYQSRRYSISSESEPSLAFSDSIREGAPSESGMNFQEPFNLNAAPPTPPTDNSFTQPPRMVIPQPIKAPLQWQQCPPNMPQGGFSSVQVAQAQLAAASNGGNTPLDAGMDAAAFAQFGRVEMGYDPATFTPFTLTGNPMATTAAPDPLELDFNTFFNMTVPRC